MGVTNSNKVINADRIECDGSLKVTLALTAAPDIVSNPTDIVLVLDRSGSMAGAPLAAVKAGSKSFIDIIAEATGGAPGQIGAGRQIGVVSFSDTATTDSPLTDSVDQLKNAVDLMVSGGSTNHAAAFQRAMDLLDPVTGKKRYEESPAATEGTCTMCGKMCAVRTVNKVFEGTTIDLGMED